jgi:RHS repeat-associated protein
MPFYFFAAGTITLGYKQYELSNHLGNVLTTITDNKIIIAETPPTGGVSEVFVSAVVLTTQDYYPFGMAMTERGYQNVDRNEQRYGFNGKENDEEWGKTVQDYGFRISCPAIGGRFFSVDPLTGDYPELTPYQFASNTPIMAIDLDGLERYVTINSPWWTRFALKIVNDKGLDHVTKTQHLMTLIKFLTPMKFQDNYAQGTIGVSSRNVLNVYAEEGNTSGEIILLGLSWKDKNNHKKGAEILELGNYYDFSGLSSLEKAGIWWNQQTGGVKSNGKKNVAGNAFHLINVTADIASDLDRRLAFAKAAGGVVSRGWDWASASKTWEEAEGINIVKYALGSTAKEDKIDNYLNYYGTADGVRQLTPNRFKNDKRLAKMGTVGTGVGILKTVHDDIFREYASPVTQVKFDQFIKKLTKRN